MTKESAINVLIKECDTNLISDGYHTFGELYEHRIELFIALCLAIQVADHSMSTEIWRSKKHSDGSEWDGWFILGMGIDQGRQITYHLPISYWDRCETILTFDKAPEWDGHTSKEVINRIQRL